MSWRDRAAPASTQSDWRSRAKPVGAPVAPKLETDGEEAQPEPTPLQSAASGVVQGGTLGFADEIGGLLDTIPEATHRAAQAIGLSDKAPEPIEGHFDQESADAAADKQRGTLAGYYRQMRDRYRSDDKTAEKANPKSFDAGEFAGTLAVPIPKVVGSARAVGLGAKVLRGAKVAGTLGAAIGAGKSEANDVGGVLEDAVVNGAESAPFGGFGGALEAGAGKLAAKFNGKAASAVQNAQNRVEAEALKAYRSATGKLGGEVSAGRNADEVLNEVLASADSTPAQKADAQSLLNDPERLKMVQRVYKNTINAFPQRMGQIIGAEQGMQEAAAKNTPAALDAAREELLADPVKNVVLPSSVRRIKQHVIPGLAISVMSGLGGLAGHAIGGEGGAAAGLGVGAGLGRMVGVSTREMLKHPGVQLGIAKTGRSAASAVERAIEKAGPVISADEDPDDQEALRRFFNSR